MANKMREMHDSQIAELKAQLASASTAEYRSMRLAKEGLKQMVDDMESRIRAMHGAQMQAQQMQLEAVAQLTRKFDEPFYVHAAEDGD